MSDVHHIVLRCPDCAADTAHEIRYAGRLIAATRCDVCGRSVDSADLSRYLADLRHRVLTKPARMLRRLWHDPVDFALTLPVAVASKPLRVLQEVATVVRTDHHAGVPARRAEIPTEAVHDDQRPDTGRAAQWPHDT